MTYLIDLLYLLAAAVAWPLLIYRRVTRGRSNATVGQILGSVPSRPVAGKCVWIHGVSLGEVNAARSIVSELKRRSPDAAVVISSTTRTGLERARAIYPGSIVFRFPFDFSFALRRTLNRIRPTAIVLMELEVWPNLMLVAAERSIPVIIANGRVTEGKSMRRFRWPIVRFFARRMFGRIAFVAAQDAVYADRFVELGVAQQRVSVTGSVKYDAAEVADRIDGQEQLASEMGIDRNVPLLVAGSTGPGEEAALLTAYFNIVEKFPQAQLAMVPRKPERFDEVAELIVRNGFTCLRRSTGAPIFPAGSADARHVFLGDTMGELRKFYGLATIVFVGRSLVPMGGSDVMEAAALAKPILVGPYTENFTEAVEALTAAGGAWVLRSGEELAAKVVELLGDSDRRVESGLAARQAVVAKQGATARTVDRILEFLS